MKKRIALVCATIELAIAPAASASSWFWTADEAERYVLRANARIGYIGGKVTCLGYGGSLKPKVSGGPRFYRQFYCRFDARSRFSSYLKLRITGKHAAVLTAVEQ